MKTVLDVVGIAGGPGRGCRSRRLLLALRSVAPAALVIDLVPIGDLALYNQDQEDDPPQDWRTFRRRVRRADAVLVVTPEHGGVPAALRNAIDIASSLHALNAWDGKPCALVSCAPGAAAFGAHHHLRESLRCLNMSVMGPPEAYIGGVERRVDETGHFTDPATGDFCRGVMRRFEAWIRRHHRTAGGREAAPREAAEGQPRRWRPAVG